VNVIVPVGLEPSERVALSRSVTTEPERVTSGLAAVVSFGGSVSVSVAVPLKGSVSVVPAGGATVTVLVIVPVAFEAMVPLSVRVTCWPLARLSPLHAPVAAS